MSAGQPGLVTAEDQPAPHAQQATGTGHQPPGKDQAAQGGHPNGKEDKPKEGEGKPQEKKPTPWLGIAAVMIGLSTSVFLGQLVAIGLSDLEGAQHLSKDQGAWLGAVYNAGQMFIGPMTVYMGGLIGPRKVLLLAAPSVALSALCLGLTTSYPMMLFLLAVAGLGCGSFYPLAFTFVSRSLPRPYLLFGIAAYAFDVISSLHVATLLEGLYMQYLSWHWIYWQPALMALVMWVLVYAGMPGDPTAKVDTAKLRPTWQGFLYASLGLTCLYLLLTQGVRLDWANSGTIVALGAAGTFLLVAALVRHLLRPNPLVDLGFIFRRNIILLSLSLCVLRASLLSSAQLVPTFLSTVQQMLPLQIGSLLAWVALPSLICGVLAAILLRYLDPRLVLALGFTLTGSACLWDNTLNPLWSRQNFFPTELLIGIGATVSVVGFIGCIILEVVNSGAVKDPIHTLTFTAWFHTVRLFGGESVGASLSYLLNWRFNMHYNMLADFINTNRSVTGTQVLGTAAASASQSTSVGASIARVAASLSSRLEVQSITLAIADAYIVEALLLAVGLLIVASISREPHQFSDLAKGKQ